MSYCGYQRTIDYSANQYRRIDFVFTAGYQDSSSKVKALLLELIERYPLLFKEPPPPQVVMAEHGDSAIIYYLRVWCEKDHYWTIFFEIQEKVKQTFDQNGITMPYPQHEVHVTGQG